MAEKITPTCRYGHGPMHDQTYVKDGQYHAFGFSDVKLSILTMKAREASGPSLGVSYDSTSGYIVKLYRCDECGYLEMVDLGNGEVIDALTK